MKTNLGLPFLSKPKPVIYLDGHVLKIAGTGSAASPVSGVYYRGLSGLDENAITEEIRSGLKAVGVKLPCAVRVLVSSKYAITKMIEVPAQAESEIRSLVRLQAPRHVPYAESEIVSDCVILDRVENRYTKVLMTVMSQSNIGRHLDLIRSAGCEIAEVGVSFDSTCRGVVKTLGIGPSQTALMVVVDADHTDFIASKGESPLFVRTVGIGAADFRNPAQREELEKEIQKSLEAFRAQEAGVSPEKLLVMGPASDGIGDLSAALSEKLGLAAQLTRVEEHLRLPAGLKESLREMGNPPVDHLLFAASSPESYRMDFIPQDLHTETRLRQKAQQFVNFGVLAMVSFALFLVAFMSQVSFQSVYIRMLDSRFSVRGGEAQKLMTLWEQNKAAEDFVAKKGATLRSLVELEKLLPAEMALSELSVEADGKVTFRGTSTLMSRVFSFVTEYESHPLFKGVNTDFAKSRKIDGKDMTDFGLTAHLDGVV